MKAAEDYVAVRVTDMDGVDLNVFRFDYDLTFTALMMNADGTIYHRYGGRTWEDAMSNMSMDHLVKVMGQALNTHKAYDRKPAPPKKKPKRVMADVWKQARMGNAPKCYHCHMVGDAERQILKNARRWNPDEIYKYPQPSRLGIDLDPADQTVIARIDANSAAKRAKLLKGDRILSINDSAPLLTRMDIQWELDKVGGKGGTIEIEYERKGEKATARLKVKTGWMKADPLEISWRPTMWTYTPAPGFGGPVLNDADLKKNGLKPGSLAFKVGYIVTWGKNSHTGKNAQKAGIRKGDIVFATDGKNDFKTMMHWHAWFRLNKKPGQKAVFDILRGGKRKRLIMNVIP